MSPLSLEQFGQTIKAKHPEYADISDTELANKVLAKYPQYKDMVQGQAALDLTNPKGEGVYQMKDSSGKVAPVPYSQVQTAAQQGYNFSDDATKFRFSRDNAADPNRRTNFAPRNDAVPFDEKQMSAPMQVVAGIAKGGATLARPVLNAAALATNTNPQEVDEMLRPQTATQAIAKYGTIGAAAVPAVAAAPVAAAGGVAGGIAGSYAGKKIAEKAGLNPQQSAVLQDVTGLAGGAAGAIGGNAATPAIASKINPAVMKENAAGLLQSVAHDANKIPVQLENAGDAALNLMDWQKKTQLGPTINKFLNRITNPKQGPLTYEEARDFYQLLGKLSVEETNRLAPPVRRDLVKMVVGLKQDIGNAADQVGQAANYYQGMGDYAKASRLQDWYDLAQKYGIRAGIAAAGAAGLGGLAKYVNEGVNQR